MRRWMPAASALVATALALTLGADASLASPGHSAAAGYGRGGPQRDVPKIRRAFAEGPIEIAGGFHENAVASMDVPSFHAEVVATAVIESRTAARRTVDCRLVARGGTTGTAVSLSTAPASGDDRQPLVVSDVLSPEDPSGGRVDLDCSSDGGDGDVVAEHVSMVAMETGSLEGHVLDEPRGVFFFFGSEGPSVVMGIRDGDARTGARTFRTVAKIPLEPGRWSVSATSEVRSTAAGSGAPVTCRLAAAGQADSTTTRLASPGQPLDRATSLLDIAPVLHQRSYVRLECRTSGGHAASSAIRIVAAQAAELTRVDLTTGSRSTFGDGRPRALLGAKPGPVAVGEQPKRMASMHIPSSAWLIRASATAANTGGATATLTCSLGLETASDPRTITIGQGDRRSLTLATAAHIAPRGGGDGLLRCRATAPGMSVSRVRIAVFEGRWSFT